MFVPYVIGKHQRVFGHCSAISVKNEALKATVQTRPSPPMLGFYYGDVPSALKDLTRLQSNVSKHSRKIPNTSWAVNEVISGISLE